MRSSRSWKVKFGLFKLISQPRESTRTLRAHDPMIHRGFGAASARGHIVCWYRNTGQKERRGRRRREEEKSAISVVAPPFRELVNQTTDRKSRNRNGRTTRKPIYAVTLGQPLPRLILLSLSLSLSFSRVYTYIFACSGTTILRKNVR